jgi:hypothetical protein
LNGGSKCIVRGDLFRPRSGALASNCIANESASALFSSPPRPRLC